MFSSKLSILSLLLLLLLLISFSHESEGSKKRISEGDCPVCEKVLSAIKDSLDSSDLGNQQKIDAAVRKYCKTASDKENRFCYYIGATEDAATGMVNEVSRPMASSFPILKICEKLNSKDHQICELAYPRTIDVNTVDLNKLKVKDLKKILADMGDNCNGCVEKSDFIKKIEIHKSSSNKQDL